MKRIIYILIFILTSINISANMMGNNGKPPHHKRHYMHEFQRNGNISPEQQEAIMLLRMEYMRREKRLMMRLHRIRWEMNLCMKKEDKESAERYHLLRAKREELRRERRELRQEFMKKYNDILKKQ